MKPLFFHETPAKATALLRWRQTDTMWQIPMNLKPREMDNSDYLCVVRPTRPEMLSDGMTEVEKNAVAAHFEYLQGLAETGVVRLAGRTLESGQQTFGIVVFTAASETEAQRLVDEDPAVREGVMNAELFSFRIAVDRS